MSNFSSVPPAPLVLRFAQNPTGRDLIVGDIHGHFTKLRAALDAVGFDPAKGDRLFSVGDLVDRGPESADALSWLEQPWFHAVQGNHEALAVQFVARVLDTRMYAANGGAWNISNDPSSRLLIADAFAALPIAIELQTAAGLVGIVHAECPHRSWLDFVGALENPATPEPERSRLVSMAQWQRDRIDSEYTDDIEGVRAVVVGHTPMQSLTSLGNVLYIDTGAWLPPERGARPFCIIDAKTLRLAARRSAFQG